MSAELEIEIRKFLDEIDKLFKTSRRLPSKNYIKFDPMLFMLWRLNNAIDNRRNT